MTRLSGFCISGVLLLATSLAGGQRIKQHLDSDRPESWAMRYFTAVGLMSGNKPPEELGKGQFALGFDIANVPHLSKRQRTVGFNGTKEENMNKAPVIARPLLHYGITDKISITASYAPPLEVFDRLETHLAALFLNYDLLELRGFTLGLRAGGQFSEATGDFTCAAEIAGIMDPEINPYDCIEPSNDTLTSLTGSAELILGYKLNTTRPVRLYALVNYTYADMEFEVDALWAGGHADQRTLYSSGSIWSYGCGVETALTRRLFASLSLIHAPLEIRRPPEFKARNDPLTHVRLNMTFLF